MKATTVFEHYNSYEFVFIPLFEDGSSGLIEIKEKIIKQTIFGKKMYYKTLIKCQVDVLEKALEFHGKATSLCPQIFKEGVFGNFRIVDENLVKNFIKGGFTK